MGAAMVVSEYCQVPLAGFILQPTCIPSSDSEWKAIVPIRASRESGGLRGTVESVPVVGSLHQSARLTFSEKLAETFTDHTFVNILKKMAELNIPQLRARFGLQGNVYTWPTLLGLETPMVIPIQPGTIQAPSDWHDWIQFTDFIFLTSKTVSKNAFGEELDDFIHSARAEGRKLMAMTFSSMPVSREKMLLSALKMIALGKHPLSLVYIGKRYDEVNMGCKDLQSKLVTTRHRKLEEVMAELKQRKLFIEVERAPFDILFREMDAFVIHGGLGTTVDALRMHKPIQVSGVLLMDQRFWGQVCEEKGVGPAPVHIDNFPDTCVAFADKALDEDSEWLHNAKSLTWGEEGSDGVQANVEAFMMLMAESLPCIETNPENLTATNRGLRGTYSRFDHLMRKPEAAHSQHREHTVTRDSLVDSEDYTDGHSWSGLHLREKTKQMGYKISRSLSKQRNIDADEVEDEDEDHYEKEQATPRKTYSFSRTVSAIRQVLGTDGQS